MDRHSTLYDSLNGSCKKSKLKSWTRHVNQKGTVYTIRFDETSAILDPSDPDNSNQGNTVIYKPKSQYHVNRDFVRMREFKNGSSIANPVHNSTFGDISYISDLNNSRSEPNVNTQLASQAECNSPTTQESVSRSNASSHVMPHNSPVNIASVEKVVYYASEFLIPPPVESTDTILPLVQFEATESIQTQNDELYHVCCISPPCLKPPVELISLSELISEPRNVSCNDSSYTDSPLCDLFHNPVSDFDFSFDPTNSQCTLGTDYDYHPTSTDAYSPPSRYVPDSKNNSAISDCSRPPENHDQQVPQTQPEDSAADFIRSLLNESKERFKEEICNAVRDSMNSYINKEHSTSLRFGK